MTTGRINQVTTSRRAPGPREGPPRRGDPRRPRRRGATRATPDFQLSIGPSLTALRTREIHAEARRRRTRPTRRASGAAGRPDGRPANKTTSRALPDAGSDATSANCDEGDAGAQHPSAGRDAVSDPLRDSRERRPAGTGGCGAPRAHTKRRTARPGRNRRPHTSRLHPGQFARRVRPHDIIICVMHMNFSFLQFPHAGFSYMHTWIHPMV